jgi:hypothetical protein
LGWSFLDFAAFDMTSDAVDDLVGILKGWTAAAALTAGTSNGRVNFQRKSAYLNHD